jgi:hypothetical protein
MNFSSGENIHESKTLHAEIDEVNFSSGENNHKEQYFA